MMIRVKGTGVGLLWAPALFFVAGCDSGQSRPPPVPQPPRAESETERPPVSMAQEDRYPRCMRAYARFRDSGLIVAGGVEPRVVATKWVGLSDVEKELLLETAACIMGAGVPGPQRVTVIADVSGNPIHIADVAGNYPFAEFASDNAP